MARLSKRAPSVLAAFALVSLTSQALAQVAPPDAARTPGATAGGGGAGRRDLVPVPLGQANPRPASEAPGAHAGAQARLAAEHAELDGAGYRAHFSRESVRVSKAEGGEGASLGYRLTRATAGSAVLFDAAAATHKLPAVAGPGALRYARAPGFTEIYEGRPGGIEQMFRIEAPLPAGADLRISGRFDTPLQAKRVVGRGVVFSEAGGPEVLFYGEPTIIDARGRSVPGLLTLAGNDLVIEFTAADLADLTPPLVVDPLIGTNISIATTTNHERESAVAWNSAANEYLVVYEVQVGTDYDIWGRRVSSTGALVGAAFPIRNQAGVPERNPDVAYSPSTNRYVLALEYNNGDVIMTTINAAGTHLGSWYLDNRRPPVGYSRDPRVVYQNNDGFLFVWSDSDNAVPQNQWVLCERANSNAALITFGGGQVNNDWQIQAATGATPFRRPSVAYNASQDNFYFAWEHVDGSARSVATTGDLTLYVGPWPNITLASPGIETSVAWNSVRNEYHVVWADNVTLGSGNHDILLQRVASSGPVVGQKLGGIVAVASDDMTPRVQRIPAIRYTAGANQGLVVYYESTAAAQTIYAQPTRGDGTKKGDRLVVRSAALGSPVWNPALAIATVNQQFLASLEAQPIFATYHIYGQLVSPAMNAAPVATPQSLSTPEDTALAITLGGTDADADPLAFWAVMPPAHGFLLGTPPNLTYVPLPNYNGPDSFTFVADDGCLTSAAATISINVTAVNDPPVANPQSLSTPEDTPKAIVLTGSDVENSPLTFTVQTQPAHGALSGTAPNLTYTPAANYNGPDSFSFTVFDGSLPSTPATISLTISPVNDAPVANAQGVSTPRDTPLGIVLTGSDVEQSPLTFSVFSGPSHGSLSGTAPNLTYTPAPGYAGPDSFTFRAFDGALFSAPATISITVTVPNQPPVANPQSVSTPEDTPKGIVLTGSDPDNDPITLYEVLTQPANGLLGGTAPNLTYTPASNYSGSDSFTFRVRDASLFSPPATVSITISPANDPPVANPQTVITGENKPVAIQLTGSDVEGDPLDFAIASPPAHGMLSGNPPALTYTPAGAYVGPDEFTFTVDDGPATSAPATVSIDVRIETVFSFGTPTLPHSGGQVTVTADAVVVTLTVPPDRSDAQIAHDLAAALSAQGISVSVIGRVLTVLTTSAPATLQCNITGVFTAGLPPEPEQGFPPDQLVCCENRGKSDDFIEKWIFPIYAELQNVTVVVDEIKDEGNPPPWGCQEPYRGDLQIGVGVFGHSGEFGYQKSFLNIAGVGMDYDFTLTYRSRSPIQAANVGPGWSHNWERTLSFSADRTWAVLANGYGRADTFYKADADNYIDGYGVYKKVTETFPWATVIDRYGTLERYYIPNRLLESVTDRNGNRITVRYTSNCNVKTVTDTLGRTIRYEHEDVIVPGEAGGFDDFEERLAEVTDFTGRTATLEYGQGAAPDFIQGDLIAITSPAVQPAESALGANAFPAGKKTQFTYDVTATPFRGNILTVKEPGDTVPTIQNVYGQSGFETDRVIEQNYGNGRIYTIGYQSVGGECYDVIVSETDPNLNVREFFINEFGHVGWEAAYTRGVRPVAPTEGLENAIQDLAEYRTEYTRNSDGLILTLTAPDGSLTENDYYIPSPPTSSAERLKRGNRLETRRFPVGGGTPIVERWTYETHFNQVKTHTSPRNFVTTYTFDWEVASGSGSNVVRIDHPGFPTAYETFAYNGRGQVLEHRRAEGNIDVTEYLNGYVSRMVQDDQHEAGANSSSGAAPAQIVAEYERDPLGRVTAETNGRGVVTRTDWNALDQAWRTRMASDLAAWAEPGLVPLDYETLTFYDVKDRVVQVNRELDNPSTPDDDSPAAPFFDSGYLATWYVYDSVGNKLEETAEVSPGVVQKTVRQYDGNGNVTLVRSPEAVAGIQLGNVVQTTYDEFDRPFAVAQAPGTGDESIALLDYYYDQKSVSYQRDGRGYPTRTIHDAYARVATVIDALAGERHNDYDASGNVVYTYFVGDPGPAPPDQASGGSPWWVTLSEEVAEFDARERKTAHQARFFRREQPILGEPEETLYTDGDGDGWVTTTTIYDRESRVVTVRNDNGNETFSAFDGMGRPVLVQDAVGHSVESTYNASGSPTLVRSNEMDQTFDTTSEYDAAGRAIRVTDNAGFVAETRYDSVGVVTETIDQKGNQVFRFYDGLARLLRTDWVLTASGSGPDSPDPSQGGGDGLISEIAEYDLNGRITRRLDDNQRPTIFEYSNRNLLVLEKHVDATDVNIFHVASYLHDENGNVIERVDLNGTTIVQTFDELNRLVYTGATPSGGNPYNVVATQFQEFSYDGLSRMVLARDDNFGVNDFSEVHYTYDSLARLLAEKQIFARGQSSYYGETVAAESDGIGNLKRLEYPAGLSVERTYDALERLETVWESSWGVYTEYQYAGPGRVSVRDRQGAPALEIAYDQLKRPVEWRHGGTADFFYGYDPVGNRTFEHPDHRPEQGKAYRYDSAYRVLGIDEGDVDTGSGTVYNLLDAEQFTYDGVGNRLERQRSSTGPTFYSVNNLNQYSDVNGQNHSYDLNGNLTFDGQFNYLYDFQNRLRLIVRNSDGATIARYLYDARGRRIAKEVTNTGQHDGAWSFLYFESRVIEDREAGSHQLLASYIFGNGVDEVLARVTPSDPPHVYFEDALGSVVAVGELGNDVLERYWYQAYGNVQIFDGDFNPQSATNIGNRYMFTGREYEPESGLYFYRARYYSPELGRFLSRDPAGYVDGLNLYAYVRNNPINRLDPFGLDDADGAKGFDWVAFAKRLVDTQAAPANAVINTAKGAYEVLSGQREVNPQDFVNGAKDAVYDQTVGAVTAPVERVVDVGNRLRDSPLGSPEEAEATADLLTLAGETFVSVFYGSSGRPRIQTKCFAGGTLVRMADGSAKEIQDICVGDAVLAEDSENLDGPRERTVSAVLRNYTHHLVSIEVEGAGRAILATREHPFWTRESGWKRAKSLAPGDVLRTDRGDHARIGRVTVIADTVSTYNLSVEGVHTYFVVTGHVGVLVHNADNEEGIEYPLKRPAGVSDEAWQKKLDALNKGAAEGRARVVHEPKRDGAAQRQARADGRVAPGQHADHGLDLQFGGKDVPEEIISTDARVNTSVGAQGQARKAHPDGTPIKKFVEKPCP